MNEKLKETFKKIKNPKTVVILGMAGILLIFLSSYLPQKSTYRAEKSSITAEEYRKQTEKSISKIVSSISGDTSPTVTVTLESGMRYTYADRTESDSSSVEGDKQTQSSESSTKTYITVRASDGGEQALLVSELMPSIRGVAIVCSGGDDTVTASKIESAVTAALNITSKRVYIAGGTVK